jgi:hypothetical protein
MVDITDLQAYLYPEYRQFDWAAVYEGDNGVTLSAELEITEAHCMGHFIHKPMLPLSEIGSLASRASALLCQYGYHTELPDLWSKFPVAVVAKYEPSQPIYEDPFASYGLTAIVSASAKVFSKRVTRTEVCVKVVDSANEMYACQSFNFKMVPRTDLGSWCCSPKFCPKRCSQCVDNM